MGHGSSFRGSPNPDARTVLRLAGIVTVNAGPGSERARGESARADASLTSRWLIRRVASAARKNRRPPAHHLFMARSANLLARPGPKIQDRLREVRLSDAQTNCVTLGQRNSLNIQAYTRFAEYRLWNGKRFRSCSPRAHCDAIDPAIHPEVLTARVCGRRRRHCSRVWSESRLML